MIFFSMWYKNTVFIGKQYMYIIYGHQEGNILMLPNKDVMDIVIISHWQAK